MSKYSLIPGMEAFMEDTSVEVDVEVGAPEEVVEEVTEAEETAVEGAEEVAEAEADAEQAEMIFQQFDRVETYLNHAKKYGVDRTFLSLLNSDGSLSQAIGYSLPACESFDVTGSPMSAESQAVIAGLEGVMGDIWNFIKKIAAKVRDFFSKIWNWVMARVGDIDKNIGRLRARLRETIDDTEKASNASGEVVSLDYLQNDQKGAEGVGQFLTDAEKELGDIREEISKAVMDVTKPSSYKPAEEDTTKEYGEKLKKFKKAYADAKKNATKTQIKDLVGKAEAYLKLAEDCRKSVIKHDTLVKNAQAGTKLLESAVSKFEAQKGKSDTAATKRIRKAASRLNELTSVVGVEISYCNWRASQAVKAAAAIISNTRKPR